MQHLSDSFYLSIGRVAVAHEFVLDATHPCDYSEGRKTDGLCLVLEGEAEYRFATGGRQVLKAGDIALLPEDAAYVAVPKGNYHHYTVNFRIHRDSSDPGLLGTEALIHRTGNPEAYRRLFRELVRFFGEKQFGYEMRCVGLVYEILHLLFSEVQDSRSQTPMHRRLQPAKALLDSRFREPLTLEMLSEAAHMSVTNFRRLFRATYGQTPMEYRDELRLSYAKYYLFSGEGTVGEVAKRCGFEDQSYFVRFFRCHTGMTPGEFRRLHLGR